MELHVKLDVRCEEIKHRSPHAFLCSKIAWDEKKIWSRLYFFRSVQFFSKDADVCGVISNVVAGVSHFGGKRNQSKSTHMGVRG